MNTKHVLQAIIAFALTAICTTGYAQNNGSAVSDTTKNAALDEEEYELIEFPEFPEKLPEFPGGDSALRRYITDNLKYPEEAKSKGLEGKVFVSFIVCETGNIEDVQVKGVDPLLDSAVVRLVQSMPKWEPAKQRGKTITYPYIFPIVFSLEKAK